VDQEPLGGHVYILVSPKTDLIKIGGTAYPPLKRIREVNGSSPYRELGPWSLSDFRQVTDWRKVEAHLHFAFRSHSSSDIAGANELFRVAPQRVSTLLGELDPALIVKRPKIDRLFQDEDFATFILRLFAFTGLLHWIDIQGAWTFVLFPGTAGGRYYTINIGRHEVAYSSLPRGPQGGVHGIVMDRLIYDFPHVRKWVEARGGDYLDDAYSSALPRSVIVHFTGGFAEAQQFLRLEGVRRALIAYWAEALIEINERGVESVFSRFHNWNAVAEIRSRLTGTMSSAISSPVVPGLGLEPVQAPKPLKLDWRFSAFDLPRLRQHCISY